MRERVVDDGRGGMWQWIQHERARICVLDALFAEYGIYLPPGERLFAKPGPAVWHPQGRSVRPFHFSL